MRSLHSWSANLMIFMAFAHMFSVAFLRAYRKPRELTWISGMVLLFLCLGFGFSGYLLPWNTLSFFATKVGTEVAGRVPIVGHPTMVFLRGGEDIGSATLARFFSLHVVILPALTVGMVLLHLLLVQKFGMSVPPSVEKHRSRFGNEVRFFPNYFLRDVMAWSVAFAALLILATLYRLHLLRRALSRSGTFLRSFKLSACCQRQSFISTAKLSASWDSAWLALRGSGYPCSRPALAKTADAGRVSQCLPDSCISRP